MLSLSCSLLRCLDCICEHGQHHGGKYSRAAADKVEDRSQPDSSRWEGLVEVASTEVSNRSKWKGGYDLSVMTSHAVDRKLPVTHKNKTGFLPRRSERDP